MAEGLLAAWICYQKSYRQRSYEQRWRRLCIVSFCWWLPVSASVEGDDFRFEDGFYTANIVEVHCVQEVRGGGVGEVRRCCCHGWRSNIVDIVGDAGGLSVTDSDCSRAWGGPAQSRRGGSQR